MKRYFIMTAVIPLLLISGPASAEHLELGLAAGPTVVMDKNYEAFSHDNLVQGTLGLDIRSQIGSVGGFEFVPFLGYRFGHDDGDMYNQLNTELFSHDLRLGLRVRKDVISWLDLFVEAFGGVLIGRMNGTLSTSMDTAPALSYYDGPPSASSDLLGMQDTYQDQRVTWSAGGQIGLEMHFSRAWLKARKVNRFCFGGEIAAGYTAHGDLKFNPALSGGDDNSIDTQSAGAWGGVNTSGVTVQIAGSLYFL
jgi:hypothetical protein